MRQELRARARTSSATTATRIENAEADYDIEDLIPREDMVVTVSHGGYVKRVSLDTYRAQRRGGKGRSGMATRDEDFVANVMVCNTHTPVLFFSSRAMVYKLKVWRLPEGTPHAAEGDGQHLALEQGETIYRFPAPAEEKTGRLTSSSCSPPPSGGAPQPLERLRIGARQTARSR